MKIVKASYQILDSIDRGAILSKIESIARTCYQSGSNRPIGQLTRQLIRDGHEAMLEHASMSVLFIVDRGVANELVRHRMASFAQESTRYCNYSKDRFDGCLTFIRPCFWDADNPRYRAWEEVCSAAEEYYLDLLGNQATPQEARSVLPMSLKTSLVVTANMREWRHILKLRTAKNALPQMREGMIPLLRQLSSEIPELFDDILGDMRNDAG